MSATLSKKQQKAQSFRARQKAKRDAVPDLPEADDVEEADGDDAPVAESSTAAAPKAPKKGKKPSTAAGDGDEADEAYAPLPEATKKRKRADKEDNKDAAHADVEGFGRIEKHRRLTEPKPKKDVSQRFILFLGNIGFSTTREQVANHFKESIGE